MWDLLLFNVLYCILTSQEGSKLINWLTAKIVVDSLINPNIMNKDPISWNNMICIWRLSVVNMNRSKYLQPNAFFPEDNF